MVEIGDKVTYVDPLSVEHNALVTNVFNGGAEPYATNPAVNVVLVSNNENESDQYGRQIRRVTSVVHESLQSAHGNFYR